MGHENKADCSISLIYEHEDKYEKYLSLQKPHRFFVFVLQNVLFGMLTAVVQLRNSVNVSCSNSQFRKKFTMYSKN